MSLAMYAEMQALKKQISDLNKSAGAAIEALEARIAVLEAKRGPGRPPNAETKAA